MSVTARHSASVTRKPIPMADCVGLGQAARQSKPLLTALSKKGAPPLLPQTRATPADQLIPLAAAAVVGSHGSNDRARRFIKKARHFFTGPFTDLCSTCSKLSHARQKFSYMLACPSETLVTPPISPPLSGWRPRRSPAPGPFCCRIGIFLRQHLSFSFGLLVCRRHFRMQSTTTRSILRCSRWPGAPPKEAELGDGLSMRGERPRKRTSLACASRPVSCCLRRSPLHICGSVTGKW